MTLALWALLLPALQAPPQEKEIEVAVDARIVLMTTAIWLATDGKFYGQPVDAAYADAVRRHFEPHHGHRAIELTGRMHRSGFAYDAPVGWILHHSDPPELKPRAPLQENHIRRAGGREALDELAAALREFARDADLAGFMKSQEEAHAAFIRRVRGVLDPRDAVRRMEAFFGDTRDAYTLIVAPLVGSRSFGPHVGRHIYEIFNPSPYRDEESLRTTVTDLVYHEFGHSFINPLVDAQEDRLSKCASLFEPIREQMMRQDYGTWITCLYEHVVRAAVARLIREERGDKAGLLRAAYELSRDFRYLPPLYRALETYEKDRKKYPSLASFMPRLVEELEKIAKEGADAWWKVQPFHGSINAAWMMEEFKSRLAFVLPSREKTADYARRIAGIVGERLKTKPKIVTDEEALKLKPGDHVWVIYGTPDSNKLLKKFADKLPFRIEPGAIVVDGERIEGERLRLIAAVANPVEPHLPIIVHTGTADDALPGINDVRHGTTAYFVTRESGKIVKQGFFAWRDRD